MLQFTQTIAKNHISVNAKPNWETNYPQTVAFTCTLMSHLQFFSRTIMITKEVKMLLISE
jgi:hypothetical protein